VKSRDHDGDDVAHFEGKIARHEFRSHEFAFRDMTDVARRSELTSSWQSGGINARSSECSSGAR
jgi:hypothetical protein